MRTTGEGKKAKTTLHIVKTRKDDNFDTFISDLGFGEATDDVKSQIKELFGKKIEEQIGGGEVAVSDLKGKGGKKLKSMQRAISKYNKDNRILAQQNCMDCNDGLARNNTIPYPDIDAVNTVPYSSGPTAAFFLVKATKIFLIQIMIIYLMKKPVLVIP